MHSSLKSKAFIIFALIAFINAFVDLGHKILIQNTVFKSFDGGELMVLSAVINAFILLPFILMLMPSSFLADRFPKNLIMKHSAMAAIVITSLITLSYYMGWFEVAFGLTLALAIQSAIYSPAKYGYIRELVGVKKLASGNGVIQAVTTSAILLGTLAFSLGFEYLLKGMSFTSTSDILVLFAPLGFILIGLSVVEYGLACKLENKSPVSVPKASRFEMGEGFTFKFPEILKREEYAQYRKSSEVLSKITKNEVILLSVVGLALFWSVAQVVLATFPAYAKEAIGITNTAVIQGIMAFAGIGIVLGSALAGRFSKNYIETGLIPLGAIGVAIAVAMTTVWQSPVSQAINFMMLGFFGGLYLVPLNSLIQYHAKANELGRVLAGNNFIQNIFMLGFLVLTIAVAFAGVSAKTILMSLMVVAAVGAVYTLYKLPQSLMRVLIGKMISWRYRLDVLGMDNIPATGGVLLLGNHISWIDWAILSMASPRPIRFVMAGSIYDRWYVRGIVKIFNVIPVSSAASKGALQAVNQSLKDGDVVCLFPEGEISYNGQLGEFKRGFEVAAEDSNAKIVPFYIRGLWGSQLSRSSDKLKSLRGQGTVHVLVAFGQPVESDTKALEVKRLVSELSVTAWQAYAKNLPSLPHAIIDGLKRTGREMAATDINGPSLSGHKLLTAAFCFARRVDRLTLQSRLYGQANNIGIMLPASSASMIANAAGLISGNAVVNLNFTSSPENIESAIIRSDIQVVLTSRKFISKLTGKGFSEDCLSKNAKVIYLEDVKETIGKCELITTLLAVMLLPSWVLKALSVRKIDNDKTAAILFSSGSEGAPKGVMLSHSNLMANVEQVSDVLNTQSDDVIMATLPPFHAFGLTVTTLMPLVSAIPVICHPDPTDVKNIAKGIATYKATILCATATFLRFYIRDSKVAPLMLDSLRTVVAGAERLPNDVRDGFKIKFNKTIFEGYGATETAPVASVNLPDTLDHLSWKTRLGAKVGTVGLPLPGTSVRIVDPATFDILPQGEDGLILIGGAQIMQGYLLDPVKTNDAITELDGIRWYHTGDKGHIDKDGFLVIVDRYSRFAKIGGEMVSLGAVEHGISSAVSLEVEAEFELMACALPDAKKGEKVVIIYAGDIEVDILKKAHQTLIPIMQPSGYVKVNEIPKLGTGKSDYASAKKLAEDGVA